MSYTNPDPRALIACTALLLGSAVEANPIIVGLGGEVDDAESRAFSMFTEIGLTDDTWISGSVAWTDTDRDLFDVTTKYADVAIDHNFDPVGVRIAAAYWGDDDLLESNDVRTSVYLRGDRGSIAFDYDYRDFDLTVGTDFLPEPVVVGFDADGFGFTASLKASDRITLFAGGMDYDYSRDIRIQPNVDTLRIFSRSRLSMINSLVDYRANVGIDIAFGLRHLDLRLARWRTEVDQGDIDSIGVGFLMPASRSADIEFRLAYDDSENFGGATVFSVFFYLFDE